MIRADRIKDSFTPKTDNDDVSEQLVTLRRHISERHECRECSQRLHKLANSVQVVLFGSKPGLPRRKLS